MEQNKKGSITVFLSLILLLVVAVIMTTIESARVNVGKAYANRALALAMDSILAEYYAPLFQEYHVFGLEGSYGEESLQLDSIETKIQNSMEYTFKPNKDLYYMETYIPVENVNILDIKTTNLEIDNINTLLDYNGDFFTSQAVSYIKYKELGNVAEKFLNKISLIEETEQAQTVLNEKFKAEESIYKIDKDITKLMKLIDGITISEKGLDTGKSGIKIQDDFVKKLFVLPVTSVNAGIYNPIVFYPLQNHFTNPISIINEIISDLDALSDNLKLINEARITYKYLSLIDQSIFTEEEEFLQHQQELQNAYEALQNYIQIEQSLLKAASEKIDRLEKLMNGTLKAIEKAIPVTEDLIKKQAEITSEINKYEMVLDASRDQLNEDFYKGLLEDFQVMERYKSNPEKKGLEGYNFEGMKNTLITNQRVIGNAKSFLVSNISPTEEELLQTKYSFQNMKTAVLQYKYDYLVFDYTGLKEPEESEGFFKSIRNLVENGIIELVVEDMEGLSKKEIDSADLPSTILKIEESKDPDDIAKKYTDVNLESGIESLIDTYDSLDGAMGAGGIVEGIGELILFQEYLFEHFQHYDEKELKDALTTLDYELEYIIMGKKKDIDNLKAIIMRILLIRTIMNVISLMSDTKRNGDARLLAAAFVGFTGLPALVTIVKTLVLFIWSFVESLVDVAALLGGKEIPLLKSKNDILVELHEIILTNKTFIKSKTESIKDNSFLALNYKDYLRIFLFMESQRNKSFRAMDLIQVNLQFRYEDTFLMQNCLYSFRINGKFRMEEKFIALPFVRDLLDTGESAYSFKITKEYSY